MSDPEGAAYIARLERRLARLRNPGRGEGFARNTSAMMRSYNESTAEHEIRRAQRRVRQVCQRLLCPSRLRRALHG